MSVSVGQIMLTPKMAGELLDSQIRNRRPNNKLVNYLANEIKSGNWKRTGNAICVDGAGHMIDGQHRCLAVVAANMAVTVILARGFEEDDIYGMDLGKKRSGSDTLTIVGAKQAHNTAGVLNTLKKYIDRVYMGISYHSNYTPQTIVNEYNRHPDIINSLNYYAHLKKKAQIRILDKSIGAFCHYAFSRVSKIQADIFFEELIGGALIPENSALLQLRNKLISNKTGLYKMSVDSVLALVIKAWNMEMGASRAKNLVYKPIEKFPVIYGEPFKEMYAKTLRGER